MTIIHQALKTETGWTFMKLDDETGNMQEFCDCASHPTPEEASHCPQVQAALNALYPGKQRRGTVFFE